MALRVGFAAVDITPPPGTAKIGWLRRIVPTEVRDPLFARAAVIEADGRAVGWLQLDTLSVRWTTTQHIRAGIADRTGVPGGSIQVAATHTHGGPAVAATGEVERDEAYLATLVERCGEAFAAAWAARQPAEIGFGRAVEGTVGHCRRVLLRDGTARTHGRLTDPDALCLESPTDPELVVLAARSTAGEPLGLLVNYACHPTEPGAGPVFSAGFPGHVVERLRATGWPHCLYLNGAAGDIHVTDPHTGRTPPLTESGEQLAAAATRALAEVTWRGSATLEARQTTVELPPRQPTDDEIAGRLPGAQRFVDPAIYERGMAAVLERLRTRGNQPAEVQALLLDEYAFVSLPAEAFCELGLRIKECAWPRRAVVVGYANGMVGYVPTAAAMARGGYETTLGRGSRLAPPAGERLVAAATALLAGPA